ncbi:MAG: SDR family oxidoreductase [Deltaproteobacteria bacterium]|nr:MAG: SDR family oxidoreductase [Deltaproteobacteria bacterium]
MSRPPLDGAVLITGASSGIGRALAFEFAPRARAIGLLARREDRLAELRDELLALRPSLEILVLPCDLLDPEATFAALARFEEVLGPVDVLVNNAGFGDLAPLHQADLAKLERMIALNCTALTRLTHHVLPGMLARRSGGILNISSGFGLNTMPGVAAYAGSKHYVSAFTEALIAELAGTGVCACHVCPGPVKTEFIEIAGNPTGLSPALIEITPETVARQSVRAFSRGRALIVPGWVMWGVISLGRLTPYAVLRKVYGLGSRLVRGRSG